MNVTMTKATIVAAMAVVALSGQPRAAEAGTWDVGDVFAAVGNGTYKVYDNAGNLKESISDGLGGFTTGCAFNLALTKLYTTNFSATKVVAYDDVHPHNILQVIDTNATSPAGHSESIVFDATGNFYVGHPDGNDLIHKYNAAGTLITTFAVAVDARGTDWIDLASDQKTLFYTSEGRAIQRFDTDAPTHGAPTQLANFAVLPGSGNAFALRLLPPGDGSGGLLVADGGNVKRLDGSGAVVQTYDVVGEGTWFSLNLDPNGTSFWAATTPGSNNFYRFNIATGAIEVGPINTGGQLFGLCVKGEPTAGGEPGCVRTQGFWKNHSDEWPVDELTLGVLPYDQQELLDILSEPVEGNGLVSLAKQLIAAKLNQANGAPVPQGVQDAIDCADLLIDDLLLPPIGDDFLPPDVTEPCHLILDEYNNGLFPDGPPSCDELEDDEEEEEEGDED